MELFLSCTDIYTYILGFMIIDNFKLNSKLVLNINN